MIIASNEGVDRIFWSHFVENPAVEEVFFQEGLIEYETWRRKPAYYAYRDYLAGLVNTDVEEESVPAEFQLYQNYPNPFNPETNISYRLATSGKVTLEIFDLLGQKIQTLVDEEQAAGVHEISFTANNLSSGIYMYHLRSNGFVQSKKMILLR